MPHRSIEKLVTGVAYHPSQDESRNGLRILREIASTCKTQAEFMDRLGPWLDHRRLNMKALCEKSPMQGAQSQEFYYEYEDAILPWPGDKLSFFGVDTKGLVTERSGRPPLVLAPRLDVLHRDEDDAGFAKAELGLSKAGEWVLLSGQWKRKKSREKFGNSTFELQRASAVIYADATQLCSVLLTNFFPILGKRQFPFPAGYVSFVLDMILAERDSQLRSARQQVKNQQNLHAQDKNLLAVLREGLPVEVVPFSST